MESPIFKKDTKKYYLFMCKKCGRNLYAKIAQKSKKCFKCRAITRISSIQKNAEIIIGMNAVKNLVIIKQNELARQNDGKLPTLRSKDDFLVKNKVLQSFKPKKELVSKLTPYNVLETNLKKESKNYSIVPEYYLRMLINDYKIDELEFKNLINKLINEKIIIRKDYENNIIKYYIISPKLNQK